MKKIILLSALVYLHALSALAASLFGAEFTLTNSDIYSKGIKAGAVVNIPEAVAAQLKLRDEFTKNCLADSSCFVEKITNSYGADCYKVTFKNGFWVQLSTDPAVVEIQTKASTAAEFKEAKPILDHLFESAKNIGITPHPTGGGGHIHMDFASTFGRDSKLFRNFLVDFMNNIELAGGGVLGADTSNAPSIALLSEAQKAEFRKVIQEFDEGKITGSRDLAKAVNTRVYTATPANWNPPVKYQALNLTRMPLKDGKATIEFRGISPQSGPEEFQKEIELFEARVAYLKKQGGLVKVLDLKQMNRQEQAGAFRAYVEESGLDWNDYRVISRNGAATTNTAPVSLVQLEAGEEMAVVGEAKPRACSWLFNLFRL